MKGKKLIMLAMAIVVLLAIPAVVLAAITTAKAKAMPPTRITADFQFEDNGSTLTITGQAKGMEPGHTYRSLVYGLGSSVKGIHACEPSGVPPLTFPQMFIGFWTVAPDGTGTLTATKGTTGNYVALSKFETISVRGGATGPVVVACGKVR